MTSTDAVQEFVDDSQLSTNETPAAPVPADPPAVKPAPVGKVRHPRSRSCGADIACRQRQQFDRLPLAHFSESMKARKVTFYRNGDPFYKGLQFAIKSMLRKMEPYQAFEHLLAEINESGLCDTNILKNGVRFIFDVYGKLITDVNQLVDGGSYVCASSAVYKQLDYGGASTVDWCVSSKVLPPANGSISMDGQRRSVDLETGCSNSSLTGGTYKQHVSKCFVPTCNKLIIVIRAGRRPRNIIRKMLTKRTATSFDQVLTMLARSLNVETGAIRRICTMYGRPIMELQDFYFEEQVFIAFGDEQPVPDDFIISDSESRFINSVCGSADMKTSHRTESAIQTPTSYPETEDIVRSSSVGKRTKSASGGVPIKTVTKVNRGYAGKAYGIPIPLLAKYRVGRVVVEGDVITVKRCYDKSRDGKRFALKIIRKDRLTDDEGHAILLELAMLRRLQHPNFVQLYDELLTPVELYFIMEYFNGGDLFDAIVTADKFRYTESTASFIMHQLLIAIQHLHKLKIVHRNIKPESILVTSLAEDQKHLKLGDFTLASEVSGFLHDIVGTPVYQAPELFTPKGYGLKADMWSAGVVCYILLCGFPPFGSVYSIRDVLSTKVGCKQVIFPSPYWDRVSDAAKDLILYVLEADQFIRGSAADVLEHPWIANPTSTANDIDIHESVANRMKDLMDMSTRYVPANLGLIAVSSIDKGLGYHRFRNHYGGGGELASSSEHDRQQSDSPTSTPRSSPRL